MISHKCYTTGNLELSSLSSMLLITPFFSRESGRCHKKIDTEPFESWIVQCILKERHAVRWKSPAWFFLFLSSYIPYTNISSTIPATPFEVIEIEVKRIRSKIENCVIVLCPYVTSHCNYSWDYYIDLGCCAGLLTLCNKYLQMYNQINSHQTLI